MKFFISFFLCLLISLSATAQTVINWEQNLKNKELSFFDLKKSFDTYWKGKPITKGCGYKPFMRMANWIEPRVSPMGNIELASPLKAYNEYQKYLAENGNKFSSNCAANWSSVGPIVDPNVVTYSNDFMGRINCVALNPSNNSIFYVGAPSGGLWKTTNGGTNYTNNTDNLAYFGFSAIEVAKTNTNIVYAGTGDKNAYALPSLGLIKSIDAGLTWAHVPSFPNTQITKILVNPLNAQSITIATFSGLFKSYNGGATWSSLFTFIHFTDIEYKPSDTTVIYATSFTAFYKSTNGGLSFSNLSNVGINYTSLNDALIAVSNSDPNFVAVGTASSSNDLMVYTSLNAGTSFTNNGMNPISTSQTWYNFAFDVSPINKLEIMIAGLSTFYSANGGLTFSPIPFNTFQVDVHDIKYSANGANVYICSDGGIYKGTGPTSLFSHCNGNLNISQIYRLGVSKTNAGKVVVGLQDNGSWYVNGVSQTWKYFNAGDGMECFFDASNDNIIYSSSQYGGFDKSINNGGSNNAVISGLSYTSSPAWTAPWLLDPNNATILYCGIGNNFYKSTNSAASWVYVSTAPIAAFNEIKVAKTNSAIIYAHSGGAFLKSTNGGTTWSFLSIPLSGSFRSIAINPTNSNDVIVSMSGVGTSNLVFRTLNGGTTWTNMSAGLPLVSCNSVVFDVNPANGFYVGTDAGVFYYLQSQAQFVPFNQGIPFIPINEMEIDVIGNKIYAATYGRGLWKSNLFNVAGPCSPLANFSYTNAACNYLQVTFTNTTVFNPTSFSWTFQGGVPATSSVSNPTVNYTASGTYAATLIATNAVGSDTIIKNVVIGASGGSSIPLTQGFSNSVFPPPSWILSKNSNDAFNWQKSTSYGGFGLSSECMWFDNFSNSTNGAHHNMTSPVILNTNATNLVLKFDLAHHQFNSNSDSLVVWISTNCGITWNRVYQKGSTQLETAAIGGSNPFYPTSTQWKTETINLNTYSNAISIMVRFTNVGNYGNGIFVDNINLNGTIVTGFTSQTTEDAFQLYPNPTSNFIAIDITNRNQKFTVFDALGSVIVLKNEVPEKMSLEYLAAGIYIVQIGNTKIKLIKQ
jgi:photosystem II stability/assembly factor-like uncharacterized protein